MTKFMITLETLRHNSTYLKDSLNLAIKMNASEIFLIDVIDPEELELIQSIEANVLDEAVAERNADLTKVVATIKEHYRFDKVEKIVITGDPKKQIVKATKDHEIDLLICGSHHYSNLEYVLIQGSVAAYLAKHARCNVMVLNKKLA